MNEKKCPTEKHWQEKNLLCKFGLHSYKVVEGTMSSVPVTPRSIICTGHNITVHRYYYREKCKKCYKNRIGSL